MLSGIQAFARLRVRLAVIVAAAMAPAGVLAVSQALDALDAAEARRDRQLEATALSAIDDERAAFVEIRQAVRQTAAAVDFALSNGERCGAALDAMLSGNAWAMAASVHDAEGVSICGPAEGATIADLGAWRRFMESRRYQLSAVGRSEFTEANAILALHPASEESDLAVSVVIGADFLRQLLYEKVEDYPYALIDGAGDRLLLPGHEDESWLPEDRSVLQIFDDGQVEATDSQGAKRNYFVSVMEPGQVWSVTAAPPLSALDVLLSIEAIAIMSPLALWLIAVAVAYFAIDTLVTQHIGSLRRVAARIGEGDLDAPIRGFGDAPYEIRALAAAIHVMRDKIADREASLRDTLDVQRRLILEIHHRVKNNLQTISSLLNLESRRARAPRDEAMLRTIQNRIHSLAMVHQNLYSAQRLEEVSLDQLARDIASHLEESLAPETGAAPIAFDLEPLTASTNLATPFALFLSEAIGNAFKHGRPPFSIEVALRQIEGQFALTVSNLCDPVDDPEDKPAAGPGHLGLKLMSGFARQIGAAFDSETRDGRYHARLTGTLSSEDQLFSIRTRRED